MNDLAQQAFNLSPELWTRVISSLAILLILLVIRLVLVRLVNRHIADVRTRYQWRQTVTYVVGIASVVFVGLIWLEQIQSLATYLGLLSAGLAVALAEPVSNLAGWLYILWTKPFEVGDRIQIGAHAGDVVDQRIFQFTLLEIGNWVAADQSTGRVIHIPNGQIFREALSNYSKGFDQIWNELPVLVTFESDWEEAKRLLGEIADRHASAISQAAQQSIEESSRRLAIVYSELSPKVYTRVEASGVLLTLRYLCVPRQRRTSEEAIWEDILRTFARYPHIDFAYPTRRVYNWPLEGPKAGDAAGPSPNLG
jgi:small-conductance mechanosensitive channel